MTESHLFFILKIVLGRSLDPRLLGKISLTGVFLFAKAYGERTSDAFVDSGGDQDGNKSRKLERPCTESRFPWLWSYWENILYALAVKLFLMPAGLLTGGTTGIGLALNRTFGVPVASFVLIFNVTMLLIGWKVMGRKFALTTVVSTFVYPIALGFF